MKKERRDKHFIKKPYYPGGKNEMKLFIKNELVYPDEAQKNKIEGIVRLRCTINMMGNVTHTKVLLHLGYGCDEEAERAVKLLKFVVQQNRKIKGHFQKTINIHFQLPKQEPAQYVYNSIKNEAQSSATYSYTITINPDK